MEDNNKNTEITEEVPEESTEKPMTRTVYTKQQTALYTVISIALFCLVYFGGKGVMGMVNRPYSILAYSENVGAERIAETFEIGGISPGQSCTFESARLNKHENGYEFTMIFSGTGDLENFAEEGIAFEYGDIEEEVRTEIYPYRENPDLAEYVYAEKFVDMDSPNREIYLFEFEGETYAKYVQYGGIVPAEVTGLFYGQEKVYASS
ncbi:MAG: hypothetical protein NC253_08705 [Ruminococcus sp.]|nr:hypothetical protein [Ruminococcus sp.]MCM1380911.1 hypothetical protein [Muribaculaceae bacterium]MCM1479046.1 hypothetical protein [Muribaculaceae bacterium]